MLQQVGLYNTEVDLGIKLSLSFPDGGFSASDSFDSDQRTVYLYSHLNWPKNVLWTGGLSYDFQQKKSVELIDAVNPKLGLQWDLTDHIRLRMAYFETAQRTLVVEQSIEPTQVAGFNQYFDDLTGTQAKRYGVALDARWSEKLYGGIEASERDLKVPVFVFDSVETGEWREQLYRAYLYWTPSFNWAASAEYRFDRFKTDFVFLV